VEAAVCPTLERLLDDRRAILPMREEHAEIRRLTGVIGHFVEHPEGHVDRGVVLLMRRCLLRLYAILKSHLAEEELYEPILEDRLTPDEAAELAHALDHVVTGALWPEPGPVGSRLPMHCSGLQRAATRGARPSMWLTIVCSHTESRVSVPHHQPS
jgi:hypothetical protein